jgi:glyoxylase-like metal-dependent hydrolase (beta-lactamase superfamily II)
MGNKLIEGLSALTTRSEEAAQDILVINFTVVTACVIGKAERWILVDTGLENSADYILHAVKKRFGENCRPDAIVLTHGHFDHVGSVIKLSDLWDVPVYAHELELPYITGKKDYPLADTSVDEGLVAKLSDTYPHTSIDLGMRAVALPADGSVPGLPEWKWIHTPGHSEGHVSLFRDRDRALIVGDAFSTTKQESLLSVIIQSEKISGPPKYLTTDWEAAENSVKKLKDLNPSLVIPSHGKPMQGIELTQSLDTLVSDFDEIAKPKHGRFLNE